MLQAGGGYEQIIFIALMFGVLYFFMIRPQQQKQKKQRDFANAVKKGDVVVTLGGMHGKIVGVEGDTVQLEVDRGVKIKFEKSSISHDLTNALLKEKQKEKEA